MVEAEYLRSVGHNEKRREEKGQIPYIPSNTMTSKPFNTSSVADRRAQVKTHSAAPTKVSRLMGAERELCGRSAQSIYERHIARGVLEVVPERVRVGFVLFMLQ
jgi:hypothetical protein